MIITLPISNEDVRKLRVGDVIYINGKIFLARDSAHKKLLSLRDEEIPANFNEMAMYHCGPVVTRVGGEWAVLSAGPTTSTRMEIFEYDFIKRFRTPIIIGKGGMGEKTLKALKEFGAVYTAYTGGAGALAAKSIKRVVDVYFLEELGIPEAVWIFEVENFGPLIVTMDSHGNNMYKDVENLSLKRKTEILSSITE